MSDYTALRAALVAGPTAGPWTACEWSYESDSGELEARGISVSVGQNETTISTTAVEGDSEADVRYIAAADPQTIAALLAALDDARRDAERYRWLRAQCNSVTNLVQYLHAGWRHSIPCHSAKDMDETIDACIERAAMKGTP